MNNINLSIALINGHTNHCYLPSTLLHIYIQFFTRNALQRYVGKNLVLLWQQSNLIYTILSYRTSSDAASLPSVWSWDIQYSADYVSLFRNPLYQFVTTRKTQSEQLPRFKVLKPSCHPSQVSFLNLTLNLCKSCLILHTSK